MNKVSIALAGLALCAIAFYAGMKWNKLQTPLVTFSGWEETGWTEEEKNEFLQVIDTTEGASPEQLYKWIKDCSEVNKAVLDSIRHDEELCVAYCIAILGMVEKEDLAAIKEFCIDRMVDYYNREDKGRPELIMEEEIHLRIEEKAIKHPALRDQIKDKLRGLINGYAVDPAPRSGKEK
jgi:hypothetical protein